MSSTKRLVQSAVLVSLALALSYIERFIPLQLLVPLPGVKLGLANVVTLIALYAGCKIWGLGGMILAPLLTATALQIVLEKGK